MAERYTVSVTADIERDGKVVPVSVEFAGGYTADIERIMSVFRTSTSKRKGEAETRYYIVLDGRFHYLYFEDRTDTRKNPRWFIETIG